MKVRTLKIFLWLKLKEISKFLMYLGLACLFVVFMCGFAFGFIAVLDWLSESYPSISLVLTYILVAGLFLFLAYGTGILLIGWIKENWKKAKELANEE